MLINEARDLAAIVICAVTIKAAAFAKEILFLIWYSIWQSIFQVSMLRARSLFISLANLNLLTGIAHDVISAMVSENALKDLIFCVPVFIC